MAGGGSITFGVKDGHVTYPEFGLLDGDVDYDSRNKTHDAIMEWLNGKTKFDNYYEQQLLGRLMYLTNYGIAYPTPRYYNAMNAVLQHDKEKTLLYSSRWQFYEEYANLNVRETMGVSINECLEMSRYETDRIFAICRRKMARTNKTMSDIKSGLDDLDK